MKKTFHALPFCLPLWLVSCGNRNPNTAQTDDGPPHLTYGEYNPMEYDLADEFTDVEIVPLETTDGSLMGYISQLEMLDSRLIVRSGNDLFIFDRAGKFISRVGHKGRGPGEYIQIKSFVTDERHKQIVVLDDISNQLLYYDLAGKYLQSRSVPPKSLRWVEYALMLDDRLLISNSINGEENQAYTILDENNPGSMKDYFPYRVRTTNYMYPFSFHPMARSGEAIDYLLPLNDTVFSYSGGTFSPRYVVESPLKKITQTKLDAIGEFSISTSVELFRQGFFPGFSGIFETNDRILLKWYSGYYYGDKGNGRGRYSMNLHRGDDIALFPIVYGGGDFFVGYIPPAAFGDLAEKAPSPTQTEMLKFADAVDEEDNPCLIFYYTEPR